jgi:hypothetical protein
MFHGFIRDVQGNITSFVPPVRACSPGCPSIGAASISARGTIAGEYFTDTNYRWHGFIRSAQGNFAFFDPPGSTNTFARSINGSGTITGDYLDANSNGHGFIRTAKGNITSFDVPGSISTFVASSNASGMITGHYVATRSGPPCSGCGNFVSHGFILLPSNSTSRK